MQIGLDQGFTLGFQQTKCKCRLFGWNLKSSVLFQLANTFTLTTQLHSDAHRPFSSRLIFSSDPGQAHPSTLGLFWSRIPQGNVSLSPASNTSDNSHQSYLCQRAMTGRAQKNVHTCGTKQQRKEVVACQVLQPLHLCLLQMHLIFQALLPLWSVSATSILEIGLTLSETKTELFCDCPGVKNAFNISADQNSVHFTISDIILNHRFFHYPRYWEGIYQFKC